MQASDDLLNQLTEYLTAACESIEAELGTVDKFIGDAVMAFWGAPRPCKDHAVRACSSALRLIQRMNDLNDKWVADGKPAIRVRIGINTSEALVGNMGTPDRMNYTAIGDGVNVASRLEGVNKDYGTNICISEKVVKSTGDKLNVRYLDKIKVKGRREELKIFELLGIKNVTGL
jgi:adenylate cyclase